MTEDRESQLSDPEIRRAYRLPDERLAALPLVSSHDQPQDSPQEYPCGCVTVQRVTDRSPRLTPFEMRLARSCRTRACELAGETPETRTDPAEEYPGIGARSLPEQRKLDRGRS